MPSTSGISNDQLADLLATTLANLPKLDFEVALPYAQFPVTNIWFQKNKVKVESGTSIRRNIILETSGHARHVRLYQKTRIAVDDVHKQITAPWCQLQTYWSIERREMLRNRAPARLIDLLKTRRVDAMLDLAKLLEVRAWSSPSNADDDLNPRGLPYWLSLRDDGVTAANDLGGFEGKTVRYSDGTTTTTKGGIDGSLTANAKWKNWAAVYTAIDTDFVMRMRRAFHATRFESPMTIRDLIKGPMANFRIYMGLDPLTEYEGLVTSANDNIGRDLDPFHGMTTFRRIPITYAPVLDDFQIVGESEAMKEIYKMIQKVAPTDSTVYIYGESGTGKELVARAIHEASGRKDGPFIRVNCSALAETLLESELFGHEKGAFTGAANRRTGRFEEANGGTLFLDEIGEIPMATQVKLLRFLQEREFERVGGNQTISVDVRIIAATNRDLEQEVRDGKFREDLYYRLNVIHINTPPLRVRRGDIAPLASHFVARYARQNNKHIEEIGPQVVQALSQYDWPGNVRELENTIERAVVLANGPRIEMSHLPDNFGETTFSPNSEIRIPGSTLEDIERYAILKTYEAAGGSTSETADVLDISVRKVQYKLKDYRDE